MVKIVKWELPRESRKTRERGSPITTLGECLKYMMESMKGLALNWPLTHSGCTHLWKASQQHHRFWMVRHLISGQGTGKDLGEGLIVFPPTVSSNEGWKFHHSYEVAT